METFSEEIRIVGLFEEKVGAQQKSRQKYGPLESLGSPMVCVFSTVIRYSDHSDTPFGGRVLQIM